MEDRQTDKSTRFAFTAYEGEWVYFKTNPPNDLIAEWGWQEEMCPKTNRVHLQGYLRTKRQVRLSQLISIYKGVHFEVARNWNALKNYSNKTDTAIPGTQVSWQSEQKALTMKETLCLIASNITEGKVGTLNRRFMEDLTGKLQPPKKSELIEEIKEEYWEAVNKILIDQPDLIGLLSQPQYDRAWVNTRAVWIAEVARQTDRQTDEEKLK
jgi:hypothetical protein